MRTLLLWLALTTTVSAAQVCKTFDTSTWTQEQKNLLPAIGYRLVFEAGNNIVPTRTDNQLCFESPTVDIATVLTEQTILNRYASDQAARDAAASAEQVRQQGFMDEIVGTTGNDLCPAELDAITAKIDAIKSTLDTEINGVTTLLTAKPVLLDLNAAYATAFKKVARCLRATRRGS